MTLYPHLYRVLPNNFQAVWGRHSPSPVLQGRPRARGLQPCRAAVGCERLARSLPSTHHPRSWHRQTPETLASISPVPVLGTHGQQSRDLPPRRGCGTPAPALRHAYFLPRACLDASSGIHKTGLHQTDQPPSSPCYYPGTSSYKRLLPRARLTGGTIAATKAFSVPADDINLVP